MSKILTPEDISDEDILRLKMTLSDFEFGWWTTGDKSFSTFYIPFQPYKESDNVDFLKLGDIYYCLLQVYGNFHYSLFSNTETWIIDEGSNNPKINGDEVLSGKRLDVVHPISTSAFRGVLNYV